MCDVLDELYSIIQQRIRDRPPGSYTAGLVERGIAYVARKVGEEAVEAVVAALQEGRSRFIEEVADLIYHLWVLSALLGVTPQDIYEELRRRMRR